jgi:hypothetical protein
VQSGAAQFLVLIVHKLPKRVRSGGRAILPENERFPMRRGVVVAGEQPLRIDRELMDEGGHDVHEEQYVDLLLGISDECPELRRWNEERAGKCIESVGRLPRDDVADSLDNGFAEGFVDRLRQGALRQE